MPKVTWSTPIEHSNDATFRSWGSNLAGNIGTAGMVKTADTGQINWVTVTRPAVNTYGGYEIWRFDDSLQATSPVFVKIEYGTSNNAANPAIRVSIGSGTNGAGTLTGLVTSTRVCHEGSGLIAGASSMNFPSYVTHTAGFFGLVFKIGAGSTAAMTLFAFTVQRSVDNTGAPTAAGVQLITSSTASETTPADVSFINYAASSVINTINGNDLSFVPARMASSLVGFAPQIFLHWMALPQMTPCVATAAYFKAEASAGYEFDFEMVGTTPRHYITIGNALRRTAYHGASVLMHSAMLWEN